MGSYRGHCFLGVLFLLAAACFLPSSIAALPRRGFPSSSNCHDTNPADDASLTSRTPAVDPRAVNRSELVVGNQIAVPAVRSKILARSFIPTTTAGKFWQQTPDISPESELARHMRSKIPARPFMPTTMAGKFWLQALDISPESELAGHMRRNTAGNFWLQREYLPSLLQILDISPESELAGHMHRTLSVCEDAGRRKAGRCATTAVAMAEIARSKVGASAVEMLQPSMAKQDDPSMAMITGLKVKEGILTCHALIFPFLVYLCENIHKRAIEVELESSNGESVTGVVECDVDNTPNECTWLGDESLVWVKAEQESEENSAIWMNQKWGHHHHDVYANFYGGAPYVPPPPYPPPYGPSSPPYGTYPQYPSYSSPTNFNTKNAVPAEGININNKINIAIPSSGTTSNANSNPNNPNSHTSNLNSNSNGLSGTNSIPSSSGLSNPDPLSSTSSTTSSSGDPSPDLNTPSSKSNSLKSSLSSGDSPDDTSTSPSSSSTSSSHHSLSSGDSLDDTSTSPSSTSSSHHSLSSGDSLDDTSTSPSSSSTSSSSDDTTGKRLSRTSSRGSGL